jgi:hypothetical protein
MKYLWLMAIYWWVFPILTAVLLVAKTSFYKTVLHAIAQYDGSFWWIGLILTAIAIIMRLILGSMNVQ